MICCPQMEKEEDKPQRSQNYAQESVTVPQQASQMNSEFSETEFRLNEKKLKKQQTHPSLNLINRPDCGISSYNERKNTNNQEFPWMVQLRFTKINNDSALGCSGTLISERHVLTSASCFASVHFKL